jgi:hypothetical protein
MIAVRGDAMMEFRNQILETLEGPSPISTPIPCVGPQPPDDVCTRERRQLARWERIVT